VRHQTKVKANVESLPFKPHLLSLTCGNIATDLALNGVSHGERLQNTMIFY